MGIYIEGMKMPKSCGYCPLRHEARDGDECYLGASLTEYQKRPDDCPLVPIQPHYDLIDHNALKIAVMDCDAETRIDFLKHAMDCINKAPVVIPSDMPTYEEEDGE